MELISMSNERKMPREKGMDHSFNVLREGYMYMLNRRRSFNSNIFATRLLGKKAICMGGKEAAEVFYDPHKFQRKGAAPNRALQTLFGKNGVQTLDGQAHKHRKEMFMSMMTASELERLIDIAKRKWDIAIDEWSKRNEVIFYEEMKKILCLIACEWAGVPVQKKGIKNLTNDLGAMFESAGTIGPNHWRGRQARNNVEKWMQQLIAKVRQQTIKPPENTVLHKFSWHRELDGNLLDMETAAVEILNILRPIVAIAIYINFIVLALHHHPDEKEKLRSGDKKYAQMFIQEVRRFYPFFPFSAAIVKKDFTWKDYRFKKGTLTILDLYGTNHDPDIWDNPSLFNPERFAEWEGSPFGFIPQGGGDYLLGHRCAGEWLTLEMMKVSLDFLVNRLDYDIPNQDLSYRLVNMPSIPRSKIIIKNVSRKT